MISSAFLEKLNLVVELTLAQNFNELVLTYHTSLEQVGNGDFIEVVLLGDSLKHSNVDGLVLHTVDVLETTLGDATLQRHLAAFEADLLLVT